MEGGDEGCHFMVHFSVHCGFPVNASEDPLHGSSIGLVPKPNHPLTVFLMGRIQPHLTEDSVVV